MASAMYFLASFMVRLVFLRYFYYYGNMEVKSAVVALTALAQETRLNIFRLLVRAGEVGCAAGEIAESLSLPAATLTFHLKELSHAGVIESQREGRSIRYFVRLAAIRDLLTYLLHDCCNGHPELCAVVAPSDCCKPKAKRKRR
jgi:DNA-binding transcriptional ArsR family regulator